MTSAPARRRDVREGRPELPQPGAPHGHRHLLVSRLLARPIATGEETAIEEFLRLVRGEPLQPADNAPELHAPGEPVRVTPIWAPLKQYGNVSDVARVRPDLLSSHGWTLNGPVSARLPGCVVET